MSKRERGNNGHTDEDATAEATMLLGHGWLAPVTSYLASGGAFGLGGYVVAAVTRIQYVETATGSMIVIGLIIRAMLGNTVTLGPKQEWNYIAEREDDD